MEDEYIVVDDESKLTKPEEPKEEEDQVEAEEASEEDERVAVDEEREQIKARRRKEKQERKAHRNEVIKRDKLELSFLRKRNEDLERRIMAQEQRSHAGDLNAFDAAIAQVNNDINLADQVIAKAIEAGNGEDVTKAMRFRDEAMARRQNLNNQKQYAQQKPVHQPPQVDERVQHYAMQFINDNPWYDRNGNDEDSAIVLAIDQSLAREGYDPTTEDYWDELKERAAKRLPDRFKVKDRVPRGGPAVGSGKEHVSQSTKREVYMSPDRIQAMKDLGVWDDKTLRNRYINKYLEWDKANRT